MDCAAIQAKINRYIKKELELEELAWFVDHVRNCPACMEELEVYYMLYTGFVQLDDDGEMDSFDLKGNLEWELDAAEKVIRWNFWLTLVKHVLITTAICLVMMSVVEVFSWWI